VANRLLTRRRPWTFVVDTPPTVTRASPPTEKLSVVGLGTSSAVDVYGAVLTGPNGARLDAARATDALPESAMRAGDKFSQKRTR
jgi:hypothetical protein